MSDDDTQQPGTPPALADVAHRDVWIDMRVQMSRPVRAFPEAEQQDLNDIVRRFATGVAESPGLDVVSVRVFGVHVSDAPDDEQPRLHVVQGGDSAAPVVVLPGTEGTSDGDR